MFRIFILLISFSIFIFSSDLHVKQLNNPTANLDDNTQVFILFVVENLRPVTSSDYTCEVKILDEDEQIVFEEDIEQPSLSGFRTENVGTSNFWTSEPGNYELTITLVNPNDTDLSNNEFTFEFFVEGSSAPCPSNAAINPVPADSTREIELIDDRYLEKISWENPGDQTMVYFYISQNEEDVDNHETFVLFRQGAELSSIDSLELLKNTTYYWAIGEECSTNPEVLFSETWEFTTKTCPSAPATNFIPASGDTISNNLGDDSYELTWENPGDQTKVEVYLSKEMEKVLNKDPSALVLSSKDAESYVFSDTNYLEQYYWSVVEYCDDNFTEFTTNILFIKQACGMKFYSHAPSNGNTREISNVFLYIEKRFQFVNDGDRFSFYISKDSLEVLNEDANALILIDDQDAKGSLFECKLKELDKASKYYWKFKYTCPDNSNITEIYHFFTNSCSYPYNEMPMDDSKNIRTDIVNLSWEFEDEFDEEFIQVYLSDNKQMVEVEDVRVKIYDGPSINSLTVRDLKYNTDYYWGIKRICDNEFNELSIYKFTTEACPDFDGVSNLTVNNFKGQSSNNFTGKYLKLKWDVIDPQNFDSTRIILDTSKTTMKNVYYDSIVATVSSGQNEYIVNDLKKNDLGYTFYLEPFCAGREKLAGPAQLDILDACMPVNATTPNDGSTNIPIDDMSLVWEDPDNVESHEVFISNSLDDFEDITSSEAFLGRATGVDFYDISNSFLRFNTKYYWRVLSECENGTLVLSDIYEFTTIENPNNVELNKDLEYIRALPNPLSAQTNFQFVLKNKAEVAITITDLLGNIVFEENLGIRNMGKNTFEFNAQNVNSGIYFYQIIVNGNTSTSQKLIINK